MKNGVDARKLNEHNDMVEMKGNQSHVPRAHSGREFPILLISLLMIYIATAGGSHGIPIIPCRKERLANYKRTTVIRAGG